MAPSPPGVIVTGSCGGEGAVTTTMRAVRRMMGSDLLKAGVFLMTIV